eukprot:scaffold15599_cov54-Attheya_sp.AAC.1
MRTFAGWGVAGVVCLLTKDTCVVGAASSIELPALPYAYNALEPVIGRKTLHVHHDKHHAKYVATANSMIEGTALEGKSLEEILLQSHRAKNQGLFNNVAQSWNHAFYWKCMKPKGGGTPTKGQLLTLIESSFGSFENFQKEFAQAGNTAFGSGWAWLVYNSKKKKLEVTKTIGADNPMTSAHVTPILTMDVWEHAYYLDYQNMRVTYVEKFLDKLVNWDFVADNLKRAVGGSKEEL